MPASEPWPTLPLAYETPADPRPPVSATALILILLTAILAGPLLGLAVNIVNGLVDPDYFVRVMRWKADDPVALYGMILMQGLFEGLIVGVLLSIPVGLVVGIATGARCPYSRGAWLVGHIVLFALVCWALGGLIALALAGLSPEWYRATFRIAPADANALLPFAWVGGSIWGVQLGALLALAVLLPVFVARWRAQSRASAG